MHGDLCKHLGIDSSNRSSRSVLESIPKCLHKSASAFRKLNDDLFLCVYQCVSGILRHCCMFQLKLLCFHSQDLNVL